MIKDIQETLKKDGRLYCAFVVFEKGYGPQIKSWVVIRWSTFLYSLDSVITEGWTHACPGLQGARLKVEAITKAIELN